MGARGEGVDRRDFLRGAVALGASWAILPRLARSEGGGDGMWLAGDLHCHTVYSHDVWAPGDDNTDMEEAYTYGWTAAEQITNAELRGLDYLAVTDHNDVRWISEGTFAGYRGKVTLIPGYEHSLRHGHAGCLGIMSEYEDFDTSTDVGALALRDVVHEDGGIFILNHPFYDGHPPTGAEGIPAWGYSPEIVVPDSVEVWNIGWPYRRPLFQEISTSENYLSLPWWDEEFLGRGMRVPMTGGSDNHYRATAAAQGVGQPTTWVYAQARTWRAVLDGIVAGRTFVAAEPPLLGGARVFLGAEKGAQRWMVGDAVPKVEGEVAVTARVVGAPGALVRFVVDGVKGDVAPVAGVDFTHSAVVDAASHSRVRAEVLADDGWWMVALTSPIYFA